MSTYLDLRNCVYDAFAAIYPEMQLVLAYSNGPEQVTPYATYNIVSMKQVGMSEIEGGSGLASQVGQSDTYAHRTVSQYNVQVQLEFIGKSDVDDPAAQIADSCYFLLDTNNSQEIFLKNNLSYLRKGSMRRVPRKRETDWYMANQFDIFFGYQVVHQQAVEIIETVELEGNYIAASGFTTTIHQTITV